jgi:hypothetical protein
METSKMKDHNFGRSFDEIKNSTISDFDFYILILARG